MTPRLGAKARAKIDTSDLDDPAGGVNLAPLACPPLSDPHSLWKAGVLNVIDWTTTFTIALHFSTYNISKCLPQVYR